MKEDILDELQIEGNSRTVLRVGPMPEAKKAFVFGIIALPTSAYVFGIVFAILALVYSAKAFKKLYTDFELYRKQKWKMILGRVFGWIGVGMALTYGPFILYTIINASETSYDYDDSYYEEEYYDEYQDLDDFETIEDENFPF